MGPRSIVSDRFLTRHGAACRSQTRPCLEAHADGNLNKITPEASHGGFDLTLLSSCTSLVDDEIQSATALGRLAYTMPSISDVHGGLPMKAFATHYLANGSENIEYHIKVDNTADATTSACPEGKEEPCTVRYSMRYTPLLHDVSPN